MSLNTLEHKRLICIPLFSSLQWDLQITLKALWEVTKFLPSVSYKNSILCQ